MKKIKILKWETFINNALRIYAGLTKNYLGISFFNPYTGDLPFYALIDAANEKISVDIKLEEYNNKIIKIIKSWDIRKAQTLIDLMREKGYKNLPSKILYVDYNKNGDWCLYY